MPNHATAEGVAVAWATGLALVPAVATTLPELSSWPIFSGSTVRGFVTLGVVGSRPRGTKLRESVISFDTWAAVLNSDRPQWGAANNMAETLWSETTRHEFVPVRVQQHAAYFPAYVHSVHGIQEPRRVPDPDESRAHFVTEIALLWAEVPA